LITDQQLAELTEAITKLSTAQAKSPSWYEHADLLSVLLYAAFAWIFWKITRNIDDLYRKHNVVSGELQVLKGAHDAYTGGGQHPCRRRSDIAAVDDEPI